MVRTYNLNDDSVVAVIGSGAGGGTLANELAQKGIDVVCFEAGSRLSFTEIFNDPPVMNEKLGWHDKRYGAPTWLCKTVEGTTMRWSAAAHRLQAHEFIPRSTYGLLDNSSFIDWPIRLEDLAPYYDKAELKMGVSGSHSIPVSAETNNYKVLKEGAKRLGYQEYTSGHMAINPVYRDGRPACRQIAFCNEGCAIGSKWSTLYTEIPKAELTGRFELRPESMVIYITHDNSGKVTGVIYADNEGVLHRQKARAICVAGNTIETTRLLLNSQSNLYPDGLANSSGHVGKHYMRHVGEIYVYGIMPGPVNFHRGARITGAIFDQQYHQPDRGFSGGYIIEPGGANPPETIAARFNDWGRDVSVFMDNYSHLAGMLIIGEDPPQENNKITLHAEDKDQYGLPIPVLEYNNHPNNIAMSEHAMEQGRAIYSSLGASRIWSGVTAGGCHNMGTARMSTNRDQGVCNKWGQCHDISNLFITDGSLFTSSGAANPTLTIVALAIRQADYICEQMNQRII